MIPYIHQTPLLRIYLRRSSTFYIMCRRLELKFASYSLGPVQPDTVEKVEIQITDEEKERFERIERRPSLSEILNLHDFEVRFTPSPLWQTRPHHVLYSYQSIAKEVMPVKAWAYYSSAADDEITIRENHAAYHRWILSFQYCMLLLNSPL